MSCAEIQEKLSAYLDGELDEAEARSIGEHVRACPGCEKIRQQVLSLNRLSAHALQAYPQSEDYWQDLTERIVAAVPAPAAAQTHGAAAWFRRHRLGLLRGLSLAGAAALLLLMVRVTIRSDQLSRHSLNDHDFTLSYGETHAPLDTGSTKQTIERQEAEPATAVPAQAPQQRDEKNQVLAMSRPVAMGSPPVAQKEAPTQTLEKNRQMPPGPESETPAASSQDRRVGGLASRPIFEAVSLSKGVALTRAEEVQSGAAPDPDSVVLQSLTTELLSIDRTASSPASRDSAVLHERAMEINGRVVKMAEVLHTLVVTKRNSAMQEKAIQFYQTHQKVLLDSLGGERYERCLLQIKAKY